MTFVLLLNADYMPIKIVSWKKAICLWVAEKIDVVEEYDDIKLKSVRFTMHCPAVIKLKQYVKIKKAQVRFSRHSIYRRDGYACMYCGEELDKKKLTLDHVMPKSKGGINSWDNLVTACFPCNRKKGNKSLEEAGLKLKHLPKQPNYATFFMELVAAENNPIWNQYIWR